MSAERIEIRYHPRLSRSARWLDRHANPVANKAWSFTVWLDRVLPFKRRTEISYRSPTIDAEVLIYPGVLSEGDNQRAREYLAEKWRRHTPEGTEG